jgi:hypothetical protein
MRLAFCFLGGAPSGASRKGAAGTMTGVIMRVSRMLSRALPLLILWGCGSSGSKATPDAAVEGSPDAAMPEDDGGGGNGGTSRGGNSGRDAGPRPDRMSTGGDNGGDTGGVSGQSGGGSGGTPATGGIAGGGSGGAGTGGMVGSGGTAGAGSGGTGGAPLSGGTCDKPIEFSALGSRAEVTVSTAGAGHTVDFGCAPNSSEVVLTFTLTQRELVYADTFGATFDTALFLDGACGTVPPAGGVLGAITCSNDACGGQQSQVVAVLGYGRHYLLLSGVGGASGTATVHLQHVPVGNGPLQLLDAGMAVKTGTTSGQGMRNTCEAAGPDNSYWWLTCPNYAGGMLSATTCGGATFDTILSLQIPRGDISQCADDDPACGTQSTISVNVPAGAGINVLTIDSSTASNNGAYSMTVKRP